MCSPANSIRAPHMLRPFAAAMAKASTIRERIGTQLVALNRRGRACPGDLRLSYIEQERTPDNGCSSSGLSRMKEKRMPKDPSGLRKGLASYGDPGFSLFLRKAFIKAKGFSDDALDRPIIGVTDTYSDFNPCHGNVPALIEAVKRGGLLGGGLPVGFPAVSIPVGFCGAAPIDLRH